MTPALSVIFFTTASGAGYGLLALLGLMAPFGLVSAGPWFGIAALVLALALVSAGLLSSTLHLGHPERAWRAVSQWRSSWLAREGVAALLTYLPALGFGAAWFVGGSVDAAAAALGALAVAGAVVTVFCTSMIYASLRPVRQWRNAYVTPGYLVMAGFSGALWLAVVARAFHGRAAPVSVLAVLFGIAALAAKFFYWRTIDHTPGASTAETATGLGHLGRVRALEAPHTEENYLMREMGFRIARKHARRLRALAVIVGFAAPLVLTIATMALPPLPALIAATVAAVLGLGGIFVERWLFFAEATHTVVLYYGRAA
ncbi:MAG TPA: DmsC/YnfH family molybdoenzyme membrane anchor subunit [Acetobacteraceae bacterium]|nr:DmsC/YnfH family molybdoenzyme membrane anchor subunit [Acetobacteraceae bacterium]